MYDDLYKKYKLFYKYLKRLNKKKIAYNKNNTICGLSIFKKKKN